VLLALPPLGYGVASIFTEAPATLMIHWLVGANLGLLAPIAAFAVTGIALRGHAPWRGWSIYSGAASVATLLLVGATFWVFQPGTPAAAARLGGLMERVVIIEVLAWYVIAAWRLARDTRV
jgi:hypothetical protein